MKSITQLFAIVFFLMFFSVPAMSQGRNNAEVEILTSAQCPMCKERIEKTLIFERGVRDAVLDMETKKVTVRYHTRRTDPDRLRKAINRVGYDADQTEADQEAYSKLPGCCRKPGDPGHVPHRSE
jgi:periplasmic mercuric ion binding protein